jgi:LacI family transcriptional regulator
VGRTQKRSEVVPTLKDVAREASVSVGTASVVLSGARSNTRVSEETRLRVHAASEKLGYRPNLLARSLRNQSTNMLGVYWGYMEETVQRIFVSEMVAGIQHAANELEQDVVLFGSFRGKDVDRLSNTLVSGKVDGVLLIAPMDDPLANALADSFVPVVALVNPLPSMPSVVVDDVAGMSMVAAHIQARGHKKVLYRHRLEVTSAARRYDTFHRLAAEMGIEVLDGFTNDDFDGLSDEELEILHLPDGQRPTAVVCWHDISAHVVMEHCLDTGISVPGQVAVTGFNGQVPAVRTAYKLTTVSAPWFKAGSLAANLLTSLIAGRSVPLETTLPVSLKVGDTA